MKKDKLNKKQKLFAKEYLVDLNASAAAERAGYSKKTAGAIGHKLLKITQIQSAISGAMIDREKNTGVTADRIVLELAKVAFADIKHYVVVDEGGGIKIKLFSDMPDGASGAIKAIKENRAIKEDADGNQVTVYDKTTYEMHDKMKALELLGRHLGMFKDKVEHSGTVNLAQIFLGEPSEPDEAE